MMIYWNLIVVKNDLMECDGIYWALMMIYWNLFGFKDDIMEFNGR